MKKSVKKKPSKKKIIKKRHSKPKKIRLKPKRRSKTLRRLKRITRNSKRAVARIVKRGERSGTGISSFDRMIKGGFENKSINLVAGRSGSGKSIFAMQFLLEGMKKGEKVLYITFEEKKNDFYKNMKKFGWDLERLEKEGKFIFLEYSPEKVKMMLDEGGGAIESIVYKQKTKRMVIDSITSFSLLFDDELSKRQSMLGLFDIIRKWDTTTLLTVQYDPSERRDKGFSSIEVEADSITLLYYLTIKNKRERFLEVLKMRGTDHSKEIHSFNIGKSGFKIGGKAKIKKVV
ncbi:MAG: ATPase domain-containing protein [archaeon]